MRTVIINSLYDKSMSKHKLLAKDVIDEILPKLITNAHYFKSKGSIFSLASSNKHVWTMKVTLDPFNVILCKYDYSYWLLPDLEMKLDMCFKLEGEIEEYFKERFLRYLPVKMEE